ncbi:alpha/beta-hydrolase [Polyplosphaeria fusca]|uniref:Alpha/beta-hydrolase n=1 Tax=Polyplosphaeria fusca TaxID=682080 RepID=A0A9P4R0Y6_9PLEO|nr:alpha/beta-hydrolase [Polyplosphaeria fusca]
MMRKTFLTAAVLCCAAAQVVEKGSVKYNGFSRNGIEVWQNVPYAQDTSGENRFKPPKTFVPEYNQVFDNTKPGPACPQSLGQLGVPLVVGNITETSEDCLNLNIARPSSKDVDYRTKKLPVMIWIHGGGFWSGENTEPTTQPDGMILESIEDKHPVMHVAINYRLGFFGFAQSDALKSEGSLNAGLRDQRLAIEWVRDNIAAWGGDSKSITIYGQSSGGLAVGMQLLAYGGTKPLPYQHGICESQALEPGITGNFSIDSMEALVNYVGCNTTSLHSPETISCLRKFDTKTLFNASEATKFNDIAHNIGDVWLPVVDGDFVPAPPSQLVREGRFGNASYMIGWAEGDVNFYTDPSISSPEDTTKFIQEYLPTMPASVVAELLALYPASEFSPPSGTNLTAEFYRSARIFRDIIMTCQPIYLADALQKKTKNVYLFDWNQTILEPMIEALENISKIGVIHTSEFAYTNANFSAYNVSGLPLNPTPEDYQLQMRGSRTWAFFANRGRMPTNSDTTLAMRGWKGAYEKEENNTAIYVIGGPNEGLWTFDGENSTEVMEKQRLRERCAFINSPKIIEYLQY